MICDINYMIYNIYDIKLYDIKLFTLVRLARGALGRPQVVGIRLDASHLVDTLPLLNRLYAPSIAATAEKAQHEPHWPWSWTQGGVEGRRGGGEGGVEGRRGGVEGRSRREE